MWTEIDKENGFGNIGTIVLYGNPKYTPLLEDKDAVKTEVSADISNFKGKRVLYHGSTSNIMERDFAEYGFSYILEKVKYNNRPLILDLDKKTQDMLGEKVVDIDLGNRTIVPTLSANQDGSEDYFGTVYISNQLLYYLDVPDSITTIELYGEVIESNTSISGTPFIEYGAQLIVDMIPTKKPVITIYLGPEPGYKNNPDSLYYTGDSRKGVMDYLGDLEYSKLSDERLVSKVIWMILSNKGDEVESVNLSFHSWSTNDNPLRNKNQWSLRGDEFYGTIGLDDLTKVDNDFLVDRRSGVILGNLGTKKSGLRILGQKLTEHTRKEPGYTKYNPNVSYGEGDEVIFDGKTWLSLVPRNLGENPYTSSSWILKNKALGYFTKQVKIGMRCAGVYGIYAEVPGTVTAFSGKKIKVIPKPGYKLSSTAPLQLNTGSGIPQSTYSISGNIITVSDWENTGVFENSCNLVLNFEVDYCYITLKASINGGMYVDYLGWKSIFPISKINDKLAQQDTTGRFKVSVGDKLKFEFQESPEYTLEKITVVETGAEIYPSDFNEFTDENSYTEVTYKIDLKTRTRNINVLSTLDIETSETYLDIPYGEEVYVEFYETGTKTFKILDFIIRDLGFDGNEVFREEPVYFDESMFKSGSQITHCGISIELSYNTQNSIYRIKIKNTIRDILINNFNCI